MEKMNQVPKQLFSLKEVNEQKTMGILVSELKDISQMVEVKGKILMRQKNQVFSFKEETVEGYLQPFVDGLLLIAGAGHCLVCLGIDQKNTLVKIYHVSHQTVHPNLKPITSFPVAKPGQSIGNVTSDTFKVAPDLSQLALGFNDGSIHLFKNKAEKENKATQDLWSMFKVESDLLWPETLLVESDKYSVHDLHFVWTEEEGKHHDQWSVFYNNKAGLFVIQGKHKKQLDKTFYQKCSANHYRHSLFGVHRDTQSIVEFGVQKKMFTYSQLDQQSHSLEEEDKEHRREHNIQMLYSWKKNYLILVIQKHLKDNEQNQVVIYDLENDFFAYRNQNQFKFINYLIPTHSLIYLLAMPQASTKKHDHSPPSFLYSLKEDDFNTKLKKFFKKNAFDLALRFAKNNGATPHQQAEISRMHGDCLYEKGDYKQAIEHYLKTTGYIELSYVNRKFLQAQHMDYLILYLEEIHNKQKQDKYHTSQLLNCYVKQKEVKKLEEFINKHNQYDCDLFDTQTAIQVCRDLGHLDLALKLAQNSHKYTELQIKIYLERARKEALPFIRDKLPLADKVKYIREFGQQLMKEQEQECLVFIKNLVLLSQIQKTGGGKADRLTNEEKELGQYFNMTPSHWLSLSEVVFPKPTQFINLFYSVDETLQQTLLQEYLEFLQSLKGLADEQSILRRLFEIYLQKYQDIIAKIPHRNYRMTKLEDNFDVKQQNQVIMNLLKHMKNEKKDTKQLLVLFKMNQYEEGIKFICKDHLMDDELLHYYITSPSNPEQNMDKILELCQQKKQGDLYIQTLKFILKTYCTQPAVPCHLATTPQSLHTLMQQIQHIDDLSPLMVLNIIQKVYKDTPGQVVQKVKYGDMKGYFLLKLKGLLGDIGECEEVVDKNLKDQKRSYEQYVKLKTSAKTFQANKCSLCEGKLKNPSVHFKCGHSYEENCVIEEEGADRECQICMDENRRVLQMKLDYDQKTNYNKTFQEVLVQKKNNNFDIISDFLGKGIFKKEQNTIEMEDINNIQFTQFYE